MLKAEDDPIPQMEVIVGAATVDHGPLDNQAY